MVSPARLGRSRGAERLTPTSHRRSAATRSGSRRATASTPLAPLPTHLSRHRSRGGTLDPGAPRQSPPRRPNLGAERQTQASHRRSGVTRPTANAPIAPLPEYPRATAPAVAHRTLALRADPPRHTDPAARRRPNLRAERPTQPSHRRSGVTSSSPRHRQNTARVTAMHPSCHRSRGGTQDPGAPRQSPPRRPNLGAERQTQASHRRSGVTRPTANAPSAPLPEYPRATAGAFGTAPRSPPGLAGSMQGSGRAKPFRSGFEAQSGCYATNKRRDMDRSPASVADSF